MSARRRDEARPITAAIASALIAVGAARAQQDPPREPTSPLFSAWLTEHLRRDPDATRAAYERAANDPGEFPERRAVAAARLVEIDRVVGDADALARHDQIVRTSLELGPDRDPLTLADIPRAALRDALAMPPGPDRDAALASARAAIDVKDFPRSAERAYLARVLWRYDAERQRLEREINAARATGNTVRESELRDRLRQLRGTPREPDVDRARAWRVRVVNLLTEGRFELAELLLERFPPTASPGPVDQRLTRALERTDLHVLERNALEALATRIRTWQGEGRVEAERALALLPY